jgi:hypothetical protein
MKWNIGYMESRSVKVNMVSNSFVLYNSSFTSRWRAKMQKAIWVEPFSELLQNTSVSLTPHQLSICE